MTISRPHPPRRESMPGPHPARPWQVAVADPQRTGTVAGLRWVEQHGYAAMAILADGQRPCTRGFREHAVGHAAT